MYSVFKQLENGEFVPVAALLDGLPQAVELVEALSAFWPGKYEVRDSHAEAVMYLTGSRDTMSPRTIFLSRLLRLYCLLVGVSMITHREATMETLTALVVFNSFRRLSALCGLPVSLALSRFAPGRPRLGPM
jgi:hypothetical protein